MIRLLLWASLAAGAAAIILVQAKGTAEIAFWEVLLLLLLVLQYRRIPGASDPTEPPLFRLPAYDPPRLPRSVATSELAVIDATTGYLSPNRRLRPMLQRIAGHRLERSGYDLSSPRVVEFLGLENWETLMAESDQPVSIEGLDALVKRLEEM